jgi:hypothetical protein
MLSRISVVLVKHIKKKLIIYYRNIIFRILRY